VTWQAAQREAPLDEFERSGMMGRPFAKLLGVNYPTFASWIQKRRTTTESPETAKRSTASATMLRTNGAYGSTEEAAKSC
jgi:transposase